MVGFGKLPVRFIIYKGAGEKTPAPDQGLTWQNIYSVAIPWSEFEALGWSWQGFELQASIGLTWSQLENQNLIWSQIENNPQTWYEFEHKTPRGLSWGSLDGRYLAWSDIENLSLNWEEFENTHPDNKTHIAHIVEIPIYKKKAIFRVRSYKDGESSEYLTSTLIDTLPRSLAKYKPPCLHIPKLYEDGDAEIVWGDIYGAQGFVLERKQGDKEFTVIFRDNGKPVADPNNKKNCSVLTKIVDVNTHCSFVDHIPLYEKSVTYRVKAYNTTDESQYLVSETIKTLPRSLAKYKPPCLHITELHEGQNEDISWGDLYGAQGFTLERKLGDGNFNTIFNGVGQPVADSNNKKNCNVLSKIEDVDTHFGFADSVPYYEKSAVYRVKAYNTTDSSQYTESSVIPIIPVFFRDDSTSFTVKSGSNYLLELHVKDVADFENILMTLQYSASALRLNKLILEQPVGKTDLRGKSYTAGIKNVSQNIGKIQFYSSRSKTTISDWDGLLVSVRFTALIDTTTLVQLF